MEKPVGKIFIKNNQSYPTSAFYIESAQEIIYEAFRVINGKPLFISDHIERLKKSLATFYINYHNYNLLISQTKLIIEENEITNGNIKISVLINNGHYTTYVYQLQHKYPAASMVQHGVKCIFFEAERGKPHVKSEEFSYKERTREILQSNNAFEALLLDRECNVTEGTRTNVFFIKNNLLYSAPEADILQGVTRKHVLGICGEVPLKYEEHKIPIDSIRNFDCAFLTGTSPKILPISTLGECKFNVKNDYLQKLINIFDKHLNTLENQFKW